MLLGGAYELLGSGLDPRLAFCTHTSLLGARSEVVCSWALRNPTRRDVQALTTLRHQGDIQRQQRFPVQERDSQHGSLCRAQDAIGKRPSKGFVIGTVPHVPRVPRFQSCGWPAKRPHEQQRVLLTLG